MSKVYNSKSVLVLQKYTPEDIQKLLNSGKFKSEIVRQLKINIRAFNISDLSSFRLTLKLII